MSGSFPIIKKISIKGYKCFKDFTAQLSELEIIVGANGSGKSSFFEFLKFLRDAIEEIPPEIVRGAAGQQIFHTLEQNTFQWQLQFGLDFDLNSSPDANGFPSFSSLAYEGELMGPQGNSKIIFEKAESQDGLCMEVRSGKEENEQRFLAQPKTDIQDELKIHSSEVWRAPKNLIRKSNLSLATPRYKTLYELRGYIEGWCFYNTFDMNVAAMRNPAFVEPRPFLAKDGNNLNSVLHYLHTEHPSCFEELTNHISSVVPGFKKLRTKIVSSGKVLAFYQERYVNRELSIADVSDGTLRLLCWFCLCLHPHPPTLICIDEPTQGIHPRAIPLLASLLERASDRTQIFVATHSSFFLTQFEFDRIAVFRRSLGATQFAKPSESKVLLAMLEDFGFDELEALHQSDELEFLA